MLPKIKSKIYIIVLIVCGIMCFITTGCEINSTDSYSDSGVGGSLSRFTIVGNYMYAVDNQSLKVFNITAPSAPSLVNKIKIGFDIETIFSNNSLLFIGTETGMYIFGLDNPEQPVRLSAYSHVYSCDPVVADENYAYVTLSTDWNCGRYTNELQIIDISDPSDPELITSYDMDKPRGLGILDNKLFICDKNHLKVYDKSSVLSLQLINNYNVDAIDVIPLESILLVVAENGLYEYEYDQNGLTLLSSVYETD